MSKKTVTTCDCGCGATDEKNRIDWFTLERKNEIFGQRSIIAVRSPLHFADFQCLSIWSSQATTIAEKLKEYLKTDDYDGSYLDGFMVGGDDSMRNLVVPVR